MKYQCSKCGRIYFNKPPVACSGCNEPSYNFTVIVDAYGTSTDAQQWVGLR